MSQIVVTIDGKEKKWGFIYEVKDKIMIIQGRVKESVNENEIKLQAVIETLNWFKYSNNNNNIMIIVSNNIYIVNLLNSWIELWKKEDNELKIRPNRELILKIINSKKDLKISSEYKYKPDKMLKLLNEEIK